MPLQYYSTMCHKDSCQQTTDALDRPIELDELDNTLWNDKCDYIDLERCANLNLNNYNFVIMQLNIRSILAHQHKLNQLLRTLEEKNIRIDVVLLCETFLTSKAERMVNVSGYAHVGNHTPKKKGGGVSILLTTYPLRGIRTWISLKKALPNPYSLK